MKNNSRTAASPYGNCANCKQVLLLTDGHYPTAEHIVWQVEKGIDSSPYSSLQFCILVQKTTSTQQHWKLASIYCYSILDTILQSLCHLIFTTILWNRYYHYLYFVGEIEVKPDYIVCPAHSSNEGVNSNTDVSLKHCCSVTAILQLRSISDSIHLSFPVGLPIDLTALLSRAKLNGSSQCLLVHVSTGNQWVGWRQVGLVWQWSPPSILSAG